MRLGLNKIQSWSPSTMARTVDPAMELDQKANAAIHAKR